MTIDGASVARAPVDGDPVAPAVVRLDKLSKRYAPDRPAILDGIDLELRAGEYLAVMGESGVGKSTLLNLLAGLDQPDSGRGGYALFARA